MSPITLKDVLFLRRRRSRILLYLSMIFVVGGCIASMSAQTRYQSQRESEMQSSAEALRFEISATASRVAEHTVEIKELQTRLDGFTLAISQRVVGLEQIAKDNAASSEANSRMLYGIASGMILLLIEKLLTFRQAARWNNGKARKDQDLGG